jgi:hypothetical protein
MTNVTYAYNFLTLFFIFQNLTDSQYKTEKSFKKLILYFFLTFGLAHQFIEISSYVILYHYIASHNNNEQMKQILKQSDINARNRSNAISLLGLVTGWLMEVSYLFAVGVLHFVLDRNSVREISSTLKYFEFYFIPLVQIYSSKPLKQYWQNL